MNPPLCLRRGGFTSNEKQERRAAPDASRAPRLRAATSGRSLGRSPERANVSWHSYPMPRQAQPTPDAYTVDSEAPAGAVAAAYRGALTAMRIRLADFSLDLISDQAWPPDVRWAVEALTPRRPLRTSVLPWVKREPSINIDLDLRKDEDFQLAVALAPYTINGDGRDDDDRVIYSGDDTGTSAYFELTETEHETTVKFMTEASVSPEWLIPFPLKNV